jgi:hypothetical protein
MAPRSGVLRWGSPENALLTTLFRDSTCDPKWCLTNELMSIHEKYDLFKRHPARNFIAAYKRRAAEWITENEVNGGRRPRECMLFEMT